MTTALSDFITANELTMNSVFIPFSQSRNKDNKHPSLNHKVTLYTGEKLIITTDYSMGSAYTAVYKHTKDSDFRHSHTSRDACIAAECETGTGIMPLRVKAKPVRPNIKDVLYSLALDSHAHGEPYESWCSNYGYNTDSRKAYGLYNECIQTAFRIIRATSEDFLLELQTACEDY